MMGGAGETVVQGRSESEIVEGKRFLGLIKGQTGHLTPTQFLVSLLKKRGGVGYLVVISSEQIYLNYPSHAPFHFGNHSATSP